MIQEDLKDFLPADVPSDKEALFMDNFIKSTNGTGRLMLFAGDQKVEHLNNDFYGEGISDEDADPEHLFRIASMAKIGVFATQFGLISRYGRSYKDIPYLVKLNSKTNLVPYDAKDPYSEQWLEVGDIVEFKKRSGLDIRGVGYTVYLGGEHEHSMLKEASKIIHQAHLEGMLAVIWLYPKGGFVENEHNPHLIAGATGVACALGADFAKVKVPYDKDGDFVPQLLNEAVKSAGRTGVLCEGGSKKAEADFLRELYEQIHIGGSRGNGTGRNIHQRSLEDAVKMANAIYAITCENAELKEAIERLK